MFPELSRNAQNSINAGFQLLVLPDLRFIKKGNLLDMKGLDQQTNQLGFNGQSGFVLTQY